MALPSKALAILALSTATNAFTTIPSRVRTIAKTNTIAQPIAVLSLSTPNEQDTDEEILRLRLLASKLRAEASALEAEKAQQMADAAQRAFEKFDLNNDGEISLEELKLGLEKELKTEISSKRVAELMKIFDTSGDGALQLSEMPPVEKFRNTLESLRREEKRLAEEAKKQQLQDKQAELLAAARLDFLNEKPATMTDRVVSILPYLFPLMDGLQYGRFLLSASDDSNPFVLALAVLYSLYRSIPFSGFAAFFALNLLSGNPSLNRLVRYNMQQAIFIDIALFFPSLILGIGGLVVGGAGGAGLPPAVSEIFSDVMFGSLLLMLAYCAGSSLLGREPDGIPLISDAVKDRMPTIDMFDDEGRFVPREFRKKDKDDSENDDGKK
ncbi:hypothetical protein ACHAWO_009785 [Cyclotella atomus]|uniref:EF-hand domain-containing protein n=1 Tax=Cyclotella atomus TaxID=382360 RepID=A0ABD3N6F2_9STRA